VSDTTGHLYVATNKNLVLNMSGGNLMFPQNNASSTNVTQNSIQFGNNTVASETISGNTSGIQLLTKSSTGTLNLIATSNVNISNSSGTILLTALNGDIDLYSTAGNVRILPLSRLIFGVSGTTNSLRTNTGGDLMINGPGTGGNQLSITSGNTIELKNAKTIFLNTVSGGNVNIPTNVFLNIGNNNNTSFGNQYITTDTSNNLNLINNASNGNLNALITNNINITSATLSIVDTTTNLTTQNFIISGTTGSSTLINTQNVKLSDPILTLANYTSNASDPSDRGIEYRYSNTSGTMKLGWFGYKSSTGFFTFYSDAVNDSEVITGTLGQLQLGNTQINGSVTFLNTGNINMNCGTISNMNTILGCGGTVNIVGSSNISASASNILLNANTKVLMPYTTPLAFGTTSNSISADSNGNMTITVLNGSGTLVLNSNVQINGTTENVYSTVTNVQDPIFSIGGITGPVLNDFKDRGIEFKWYNSNTSYGNVGSKTGFFGYSNSINRFVFIPDGSNVNEIYSGSYGNVQFNNGYFANIDTACGTISNVNTILGCNSAVLNIVATSNINTSTSNLMLPYTSKIGFGTTSNSISATSNGNLNIISTLNTNLTSTSGGINIITNTNGSGFVNISQNVPLNFGKTGPTTGTTLIQDTSGNMNIITSTGNIYLTPIGTVNGTSANVILPTYSSIGFSGTDMSNRIDSDGSTLNLFGYNGITITGNITQIGGNVNILGSVSATSINSDVNNYITPLGTSSIKTIYSITNVGTGGSALITTTTPNYLAVGDSVNIRNSNSKPTIDGTYTVTSVTNSSTFTINTGVTLTTPGSNGSTISDLVVYQGKDVGIQVQKWASTVGNTQISSGTAGYFPGFYGWKDSLQRYVLYSNATIANNVVTQGVLGDVQINELFANKIGGFVLDGPITGGNFAINTSNLQATGGLIDSVPVGQNTPQYGRFTNLLSTISASLTNLSLQSTMSYSIDRYTLSSLQPTRSPSTTVVVTFFTISGVGFNSSSGTMGTASVLDGQVKKIVCSSMGTNSTHTIFFGAGNLITPNPLGGTPTKAVFKRSGQSMELIFDKSLNNSAGAWILTGGNGVYIQ
jgi:hypothetical protein